MKKVVLVVFGIFCITSSAGAVSFVSLPEKYQTQHKLSILIVPGHDNQFSGAASGDMREADINLKLASILAQELQKDPTLTVTVSRDTVTGEYIPQLANYFNKNQKKIEEFIKISKKAFTRKQNNVQREQLDDETVEEPKQVPHGNANPVVAYRLYATNKWAHEQDFDVIFHIHFNDTYPRGGSQGQYGGYSIYVPGHGLQNEYPSNVISGAIGSRLHDIVAKTNLGLEANLASDVGVIPDNKLIALGSNDTLEIPSVLIEYSYIYEPHVKPEFWNVVLPAMGRATVLGIYDYLQDTRSAAPTFSYTWNSNLAPTTVVRKADVVALQMALRNLGLYPPVGKTSTDCPVTGGYGPCTKRAVSDFQKSQGLEADGVVGAKTRAVLNSKFTPAH